MLSKWVNQDRRCAAKLQVAVLRRTCPIRSLRRLEQHTPVAKKLLNTTASQVPPHWEACVIGGAVLTRSGQGCYIRHNPRERFR